MKFVTRDGRPFGDVAERDFDVELRERLLHEARVGHQFLLGLGGLDGHVRVLEKIHRGQLIIANHRHARDGHGLGLFDLVFRTRRREAGDGDGRLGLLFNVGLGRLGGSVGGFFCSGDLRGKGGFGCAAKNIGGRGGGDFFGGNNFRRLEHGFGFLGRFGWRQFFRQGRLFVATGGLGLRERVVAHLRLRHGLQIGAESAGDTLRFQRGGGGLGHLSGRLFFEFALLLFEFAGLAVERDFFGTGGQPGFGKLATFPEGHDPMTKLKTGERECADENEREENHRRTGHAEQMKTVFHREAAEQPAETGRADGVANPRAQRNGFAQVRVVNQVEQARDAEQHERRPDGLRTPAFAQMRGGVVQFLQAEKAQHARQMRRAKQKQKHRHEIRRQPEQEERRVRDLRAGGADEVGRVMIRGRDDRVEVVAVVGDLRDEEEERHREDDEADVIVKPAVG